MGATITCPSRIASKADCAAGATLARGPCLIVNLSDTKAPISQTVSTSLLAG
ncbi:unannotated protein [freshwater metagenome]|uniref:Unannotated protein n=1 Tax=freshwater metagenome TaxID=449393 RepID=A0A6J6EC79_9ZZZZ